MGYLMARQHATPVYVPSPGSGPAVVISPIVHAGEHVLEDYIQALVHSHPSILPIGEIDPIFVGAISVCRELSTPAGPIDNFLVTSSGLPVLVECKLWRNAEARREVVGQILDYAKELARFTVSDLQREVAASVGGGPTALMDLVRTADPAVDEVQFGDNLTTNLRRGRFLLLLVGDGIRERVEAIADYLREHAGLHFSLGLVELAIYDLPTGGRLVAPRVLAHTHLITRTVVATPEGFAVQPADSLATEAEVDPEAATLGDQRQVFWTEFLERLKPRLDDPEQPFPRAPRNGYVTFTLPAPGGTSWLTAYRDMKNNEVGVFLSSHRDTAGDHAMKIIDEDWDTVGPLLNGTAYRTEKDGRARIGDALRPGPLDLPEVRDRAFEWLAERTNTFINVLRPRVRSAVADYLNQ
jgi:hypothetical protein